MFSYYISCFQAVGTNIIEDREEELCRFVKTTSTPCSRQFCRKTMHLLNWLSGATRSRKLIYPFIY